MGDHVAGRTDQGEVAAHGRREYEGHQESGALESGLGCDSDHNRDQDCCRSRVGENAAHQTNDDHDRYDQASLCFGKLCDNASDLIGHSRFKKRAADDEHRYEQDDVGVDEARKCGLDIENACDTEADADDHGCEAERNLLRNEHNNGKSQKNQCNCGWTHFLFPP